MKKKFTSQFLKMLERYRTAISPYFKWGKRKIGFIACMLILMGVNQAEAQVTISTSLVEKNAITSVLAGQTYTLQLSYSVSSTTGSAVGMKATIDLPDSIEAAGPFVGTVDAPASNFVYTSTGDKKIVISFNSPLASGSSGVLEFRITSKNFTTLDNTPLITTAVITDNGGHSSSLVSNTVIVHASPFLCAKKVLLNGGAVSYPTTYRIYLSGTDGLYGLQEGLLKPSNVTISDQLPTGAEFISAKVYKQNAYLYDAVYDAGTGIVTAAMPDLVPLLGGSGWQINFIPYVDITVKYSSPTFNAGDSVTNIATVQFTPLGQPQQTLVNGATVGTCVADLIEGTRLVAPVVSATISKSASATTIYSGQSISYELNFNNTGNVPLDSLTIVEDIPPYLRIDTTAAFKGFRVDGPAGTIDHYEYQTSNSAGNWIALASGITLPATPPDGGYITKIKFVFTSPFPANTKWPLNGYVVLTFKAVEVGSSTALINCITWNSITLGLPVNRTGCATGTLNPRPSTAKINYIMSSSPGCGFTLNINQAATFTGIVSADGGYSDAEDPVCAMFIPTGFKYISGSETFSASGSGITVTPVLEIVHDYITIAGNSYNMYRWTFPLGTTLPYGKSFSVTVSASASASLIPGTSYTGNFIATAANASVNAANYNYGNFTDTNDWDLDGNTTETFGRANSSYTSCNLSVLPSASLQSIKLVKGLLDSVYTRYPAVANTVPGGNADYKLIVKNSGNVAIKNITLIDILPYEGDRGVIDTTVRGSEWRPNLAGLISAPAGITVYYSTVANPCRDEVKQPSSPSPYPSGCTAADWSTTAPADLTQVQSVKIDFGATILAGGDSLVFSWPMRAPVLAHPGDVAWSSFAFTATRADNNVALIPAEPNKVGIRTLAGSPGFFGDKVWYDTDHDGIQDAEEGGINGVIVRLFTPATSGVQNPATDPMFSFTITGNGGAYLFSNLPSADYYAVLEMPSGYTASPANVAGSTAENNSDGNSIIYNGSSAVMTPITTISSNEEDLLWDQGMYCGIMPSVPSTRKARLGENITITATGGTIYEWTGPNGFIASASSITINNFAAKDTGIYFVNIIDGICSATMMVTVELDTTIIIGDKVWIDSDVDGIQDVGEPGMSGVIVTLYNSSYIEMSSTITDASGLYQFGDLLPGLYYIKFTPPPTYTLTISNGTDVNDAVNSDANTTTGFTSAIILHAGETELDVDAGMVKLTLLSATGITAQAALQGATSNISWTIRVETNISRYEVERSTDNHNFSKVGISIMAVENKGKPVSYQFDDNITALKDAVAVYYRIKAVSKDGSVSYSNITFVKGLKTSNVSVWPNPVKDRLSVNVSSGVNGIVETSLLDIKGKQLQSNKYKVTKGNNQFIIDGIEKYAKGIYILEVNNNNERTIIQLIKD